MNQNRNNNNRRRGRGNNRGGQGGGGNMGNRIDSRARGNAPQMLEKYRKLAHDASLNGDRVQTEYYLQFADHYFRVVADSRTQKDDQRPRRDNERDDRDHGYETDDYDTDEQQDQGGREPRQAQPQPQSQQRGRDRDRDDDRGPREARDEGPRASEGDDALTAEDNPFTREARAPRPRTRGRARPANDADAGGREDERSADAEVSSFDPGLLPPSIVREEEAEPRPRPRTRARKTRPVDDSGDEALEAVS
ncbi:DUF4167 domain-containing protein [Altererythrobacter sp. Root672]|uniref:DUF4167 domain-containing protein n=1 Tax=Altererythrobacter sp. Root672 TaxID=1736584 RepID=UPI0006FE2F01|nr:DUF4167 domain-containing protein [Altererythrobacter sp. Root672]KRA80519.1 hypothetical protein ASD76_15255 [Altererythrobacter sp. Root672]